MSETLSPRLPLTPAQAAMRDGHLQDPQSSAYSQAQIVWYSGENLTEEVLVEAFNRGLRECETLLLKCGVDESGNWYQQFDPAEEIPMTRIDLTGEGDPRAAALTIADREIRRALQISGPELPFRSYLFVLGEHSFGWLLVCHHVVIDGYGANLLRSRVGEILDALVNGNDVPDCRFGRIAEMIAVVPEPDPADLEFWRQHLEGAPEVISFADRVVPPAPLHSMIDVLTPDFVARVAETLDGVNWAHVAAAAAIGYVSVLVENPTVVVGLPVTGRFAPEEKITPSQSMGALPLHLTVDHSAPLPELVRLFQTTFRSTRNHQRQAPHTLRAELPVAWRTGRIYGPMINVIPFEVPSTAGSLESGLEVIDQGPIDDLAMTMIPGPDNGIRTKFLFNPDLYGPQARQEHADRLGRWLEQIVENTSAILADLVCLTEDEEKFHSELEATAAAGEPSPLGWREPCTVADLAAAAGVAGASGISVRSALGRPSVIGSPGRVTLHSPRGEHRTDLLVALRRDGAIEYRGKSSDRVAVNGSWVELEGVRNALARDARCAGAEISVSERRITVRLGRDSGGVDRADVSRLIGEVTAAPVVVR
ncbi:condensation domain-containing protein [Dietzia sp. MNB45]|uniref:condensation domain-containing protein n=1 Tax=Dietzia sp. MNB45 TaxID=3238800 RepID=UPI003F808405